jgi:hypothetical protein
MFEVLRGKPMKRDSLESLKSKANSDNSFVADKAGNASHKLWRQVKEPGLIIVDGD